MRSVLSLFLALALFLSLTACASDITEPDSFGSVPITSSTNHSGSDETIHIHVWKDASCTSPKTCSSCGATEGQAVAHSWENATCTSPKKCMLCGTAEGTPLDHAWTDATCTSPKKCALCGTADGNPLDHSWIAANCTTPKTCSVCGKTTGSASAHNYANGTCTACGKADPSDPDNIMVWIPTNGGTKYHSRSGCSNMKKPEYVPLSTALVSGYTACQRCH